MEREYTFWFIHVNMLMIISFICHCIISINSLVFLQNLWKIRWNFVMYKENICIKGMPFFAKYLPTHWILLNIQYYYSYCYMLYIYSGEERQRWKLKYMRMCNSLIRALQQCMYNVSMHTSWCIRESRMIENSLGATKQVRVIIISKYV